MFKQAMMTLQGMADHRFTRISLSTNVFLGEIISFPLNIATTCLKQNKTKKMMRKWRPKVNKTKSA